MIKNEKKRMKKDHFFKYLPHHVIVKPVIEKRKHITVKCKDCQSYIFTLFENPKYSCKEEKEALNSLV